VVIGLDRDGWFVGIMVALGLFAAIGGLCMLVSMLLHA
jgi:hypothetical protein